MKFDPNPAQSMVARTLDGCVVVSAGAGTGKTRALTERFIHAVTEGSPVGVRPARVDEILTITYTEKAAGEIAERIRLALRQRGLHEEARRLDAAWLSTIHGFCARLLRRHSLEAGLDPGFVVADEVSSGFLGDEAIEHSLRTGLERSPQVRALLDEYGIPTVSAAVTRVARELRTRGLGTDDLLTEAAGDAGQLLAEAISVLEAAAAGFSPFAEKSAGTAASFEACSRAASELRTADKSDPMAVAQLVWEAMNGLPAPRCVNAVKEVAEQLRAKRIEIGRGAAAIVAAPLLEGLREVCRTYAERVEQLKADRGLVDFDDLQLRVRDLLDRDERVRDRYRDHFRLVMVDEFQDTDETQLALVEQIAGPNLCTVGDARQSIYAFRGADVEVYRRHREAMEAGGAACIDLVENYRSHPAVIAFVNTLFESDEMFGPGSIPLVASRTEPAETAISQSESRVRIEVVQSESRGRQSADRAEASAVAEQFDRLRTAGVCPADMVVLVRTYRRAPAIAEALEQRGFDVSIVGGNRFYDLPEIATMRALCSVIANPFDDRALASVLLSDLSEISNEGAMLLATAPSRGTRVGGLWEALKTAGVELEPEDARAAERLRSVLEAAIEGSSRLPLSEVLTRALEESQTDLFCLKGGSDSRRALSNVQKFLRKAELFERSGEWGAAAFVARITAEERYGRQESPAVSVGTEASTVRIMSVHASKGLEFPVVAIPFCGDGAKSPKGAVRLSAHASGLEAALSLPGSLAATACRGLEQTASFERLHEASLLAEVSELKRQFYVACTRAREVLVLTGRSNPAAKTSRGQIDSPRAWIERAIPALLEIRVGDREVREHAPGHTLEIAIRDDAAPESPQGAHTLPTPEDGAGSAPEVDGTDSAVPFACAQTPRDLDSADEGVAPLVPEHLSASDLSLFERCSLRYWGERVAGYGDLRDTGASSPVSFGLALHASLQLDRPELAPPDENRIAAIGRFYGLDAASVPRLEGAILDWWRSDARRELHAHETVHTEHPFVHRLTGPQEEAFDLVGSIDAFGRTGSAGLVVDYKTGSSGVAGELRARYAVQAKTYAYAALREGCQTVDVSFVRPEVTTGDGEMQQIRFRFAEEDLETIEHELVTAFARIAHERYRPLSRWDRETCTGCRLAGAACPLTPLRSVPV